MAKTKKYLLDFEVDKLTNSIENVVSGESQATDVRILNQADLKQVVKKQGWLFKWKEEFRQPDRDVFKLIALSDPAVIHGLMSITRKPDHIYMNLIESAVFNRGRNKLYLGVPSNLVAFACRLSFHHGNDGIVSFTSKTKLIDHYIKTLQAVHAGRHLMVIPRSAALVLVDKYFPNTER